MKMQTFSLTSYPTFTSTKWVLLEIYSTICSLTFRCNILRNKRVIKELVLIQLIWIAKKKYIISYDILEWHLTIFSLKIISLNAFFSMWHSRYLFKEVHSKILINSNFESASSCTLSGHADHCTIEPQIWNSIAHYLLNNILECTFWYNSQVLYWTILAQYVKCYLQYNS